MKSIDGDQLMKIIDDDVREIRAIGACESEFPVMIHKGHVVSIMIMPESDYRDHMGYGDDETITIVGSIVVDDKEQSK